MARAIYVEAAKKPIYKRGKKVEYVSKRGKRAGQTLTKLDRSQPADADDEILINVGEPYYTWQFYGERNAHYSKTRPRQSQLTNNWFKKELYSIQERVEDVGDVAFAPKTPEELSDFISDITDDLQSLLDDCQTNFDNIPEQLQEGDAGQTLQARIENLESAISELENIDAEFESDLDENATEDAKQEEIENWISDRIDLIQAVDLSFE